MATGNQVQPPLTSAAVASRQPTFWRDVWRHRLDYLFISPHYLIFLAFFGYPLVWAFLLSFQSWHGFGDPVWVGIDNYVAIVNDEVVRFAFVNTLIFAAVLVPTGLLLALIFAVLLNNGALRARGVYRTIYFLPYITSSVIVGIVFKMLLDDTFGWANVILKFVGLEPVSWLRTGVWAKISIMTLAHWQGLGYSILIMLGGLQSISHEVYEAAQIDGANPWQIFWRVTLPLMQPVILFVTLVGTIGVLNMFNQPYILTSGGPDAATATLSYRLYEIGFTTSRFSDAAALGFIIGALVIVTTMLQFRLLRSWRQ